MIRSGAIVYPQWAGRPVEEDVNGHRAVVRFDGEESSGLHLSDLSHLAKALAHGPAVEKLGLEAGRRCSWDGRVLAGLVSPGEAVILGFGAGPEAARPYRYYTDMTDAWVALAVFGPGSGEALSRLTPLDPDPPGRSGPLFLATAAHGLGLFIFNPGSEIPGFVLAGERSHGQALYDSCLQAGRSLGLRPAGWGACRGWLGPEPVDRP